MLISPFRRNKQAGVSSFHAPPCDAKQNPRQCFEELSKQWEVGVTVRESLLAHNRSSPKFVYLHSDQLPVFKVFFSVSLAHPSLGSVNGLAECQIRLGIVCLCLKKMMRKSDCLYQSTLPFIVSSSLFLRMSVRSLARALRPSVGALCRQL